MIPWVIMNAFFYQQGDRYPLTVPNPAKNLNGETADYGSEALDTKFMFLDKHLVGVYVSFFNEKSPVPELEQKYGARSVKETQKAKLRLWDSDPGRLVLWDNDGLTETVYYFDQATYNRLATKTRSAKDAEEKKDSRRLD